MLTPHLLRLNLRPTHVFNTSVASQAPSIQSFFSSSPSMKSSCVSNISASHPSHSESSPNTEPGDGFTAEEVGVVLSAPVSSDQWIPNQEYEEVDIGALQPGPKFVTFMGRIVNLHNMPKSSKSERAARGLLKLTVADDTGVLTVRLYYANTEYKVRLGQLMTIWTVHVSCGEHSSLAPTAAPLFTSIFPERERSCHIMVHETSDDGIMFKTPFGYKGTKPLPGLMTVKNFHDGGYGVDDCKVLVCVKSIGPRKTINNKKGTTSELISIGVFDDTADASLTLFGAACTSASTWQPSHTVLLLSNPGWRIDRSTNLSLHANTQVHIDPNMSDALWLRSLAQRLTKKEHVNPQFPAGVFDCETAETAQVRILYNLADIDEFARASPKERFMGYISVIVTEVNITINYKRNMLMSTECCGIPIFANSTTAKCKQCEKHISLRINPRILGPVVDETGQVSSGKLVFSDAAWEQLLGRTPEQLVGSDLELLKMLEHRLLFLRLSLGFGWCLESTVPEAQDVEGEYTYPGTRGRKRRKLDVFKIKETDARTEKESATGSSKGKGKGKEKRAGKIEHINAHEKKSLVGDGVGEVGRLCIWCVKM